RPSVRRQRIGATKPASRAGANTARPAANPGRNGCDLYWIQLSAAGYRCRRTDAVVAGSTELNFFCQPAEPRRASRNQGAKEKAANSTSAAIPRESEVTATLLK